MAAAMITAARTTAKETPVDDCIDLTPETGVRAAWSYFYVRTDGLGFRAAGERRPCSLALLRMITFNPDGPNHSLAKSFPDKHGATYPDMSWESNESFLAVADFPAGRVNQRL